MNKKIFVGSIIGLAIGLPQGINAVPMLNNPIIPVETILIITIFGLVAGAFMGFSMINDRISPRFFLGKYFDLYACFLVGTLCIGLPIFIQNGVTEWQSNLLFSGYFFTSAGIGLLIGGLIFYGTKRT